MGPGEALIEVRSMSVNYADTMRRRNQYLTPQKLSFVPGSEVAVAEVENVTAGDRVMTLLGTGGENVQPEKIEEALRGLEGVEDAVVVPVPDREFGERPVAFVKMAEGASEPGDLAAALEAVLPRFEVPVRFHGWPVDAGHAGMKVDRSFFRERALCLSSKG